jgi:hypothetical protein
MFNTLSSLKILNPAFGGTDPIYAVLNSNFIHRWGYLEFSGQLHPFDLTSLVPRQEKLAFWINLYNTIVVQGIF